MWKKSLSILITSVVLFTVYSCKQKVERPNILWINCDDLGIELACYGNKDVKTPNIDRLASEGVLYSNCFANAPVCSPSRSSMITGMYPSSINSLDHRTVDKTHLPDGIKPITEYFREAGYFCTNGNAKDMTKPGKTDFNFLAKDIFDGTDWSQRSERQPFFSQVQIKEPHRSFVNDPENPVSPERVQIPDCYPDHPLIRTDWARYLETIQLCDKRVGYIIQRLEDEGLADNTIVILFGDNGRPHLRDKQFLYEGGLRVPLIIRWPEKLKAGSVDDQLISLIDVTATSLDMARIPVPDHMQGQVFLGEKAVKREYVFGFRQRMGDAVDDSRSISNGRYKLIWNKMPQVPWMQMSGYKKMEYPAFSLYHLLYEQGELEPQFAQFMAQQKPEIELYDLQNDPMEFNNLSGDSHYEKIKMQLYNTLIKNLDQFEKHLVPERPESIQKAKDASAQYFNAGMAKKGLSNKSSYREIVEYWNKKLLKQGNQ
jgi:uncharacterized sulfatase